MFCMDRNDDDRAKINPQNVVDGVLVGRRPVAGESLGLAPAH